MSNDFREDYDRMFYHVSTNGEIVWRIRHQRRGQMSPSRADKSHKTPQQRIQEALGLVQAASLNNRYLHLSQKYAYSFGQTAVVLCYVTCPDAMANEIKQAVDEAVQSAFAKHGLSIHKPQ